MKRFALLFVALVLSIQATGCDSGSGGSPTAESVRRASDPHVPAEVKEYEAKNAKKIGRSRREGALPRPANRRPRIRDDGDDLGIPRSRHRTAGRRPESVPDGGSSPPQSVGSLSNKLRPASSGSRAASSRRWRSSRRSARSGSSAIAAVRKRIASKRWPSRSARRAISSASRAADCGDRARDIAPGRVRSPPSGAAARRRPSSPTPLLQLLEALQRLEILGGLRDEGGQLAPLAFDIPARRRQPGRQAVDLRGSRRARPAGASGRPARRRADSFASPSPAAPARRIDHRGGAGGSRRSNRAASS